MLFYLRENFTAMRDDKTPVWTLGKFVKHLRQQKDNKIARYYYYTGIPI